jgi:hypothetical protein
MSNVLIGIIGVILFIGLALAGALFLGPRFQQSANDAKASAAVQAVKQVTDAANMYRLETGKPIRLHESAKLVDDRYLKSMPQIMGRGPFLIDAVGCAGCAGSEAEALGVGYYLGTDGEARRVCEAVSRQTGQTASGQPFAPTTSTMTRENHRNPTGCALVTSNDEYYVFSFL